MPYTIEFTDDEVNHFFNIEIGVPKATMVKLREKGTNRPEDLVEFNANDVIIIDEALRKPGSLVPLGGSA